MHSSFTLSAARARAGSLGYSSRKACRPTQDAALHEHCQPASGVWRLTDSAGPTSRLHSGWFSRGSFGR